MGLRSTIKSVFGGSSNEVINHSDYKRYNSLGTFVGGMVLSDGTSWTEIGGNNNNNWMYVNAFMKCNTLSAVITKTAEAFANGETWVLRTNGRKRGEEIDTAEAKRIKKLLAKPNAYQTRSAFESELVINTLLFGWCILYADKAVGFKNVDAKSIHVISPSEVEIEYKDNSWKNKNRGWDDIVNIWVVKDGQKRKLYKDNCYIIRDIIPNFCINGFLPTSRVDTISSAIQNIIDGMESRGVLLRERGIRGIITNRTSDAGSWFPVNPQEKEEFMNELKGSFGLLKGQHQIAFSNKDLLYQKMSVPFSELGLMEEDDNSKGKVCDAYGFPKLLLSNDGTNGATNSNMQVATRNLYQNLVMPFSKNIFEQINDFFETDNLNMVIERDYSKLSVLQPDQKEYAEAKLRSNQANNIAFQMGVINLNEWRKDIDEDPITDFNKAEVWYWDIQEKINKTVDIKDTQVNDGNSINTINNEGTLNETV